MDHSLTALRPLLEAEAAAEAYAAGIDAADLEQCLWLRLLEHSRTAGGPPGEPATWLRAAARAEVRGARRRARREVPYGGPGGEPPGPPETSAEAAVLAAERRRSVRSAVRRLPGRCPVLIAALLRSSDPTYRDTARELGISPGSLGPSRSRCLAVLRRMLVTEVAGGELWGKRR